MKKIIFAAAIFVILSSIAFFAGKERLPQANQFLLSINNCSLEADKELVIREGDEVTLLVTVDRDAQFHIHGYDLRRELKAGQEEKIIFRATDPGRYELELHGGQECREMGELVVTDQAGNVPQSTPEVEPDHDH